MLCRQTLLHHFGTSCSLFDPTNNLPCWISLPNSTKSNDESNKDNEEAKSDHEHDEAGGDIIENIGQMLYLKIT